MLLCPNCTGTLQKPIKYAEGAWNCPDCGEDWFIVHIGKPKVSYGGKQQTKLPAIKKPAVKAAKKKTDLLKYWI
jgi:hypothetical protein